MHPQVPAPQPSGEPGILGQLCQELAAPQPTNLIPRGSFQLGAWLSQKNALRNRSMMASFEAGSLLPLNRFQELLDLMTTASSVITLGLLHMRTLQL